MAKPTGFQDYARELPRRRPIAERIKDYREFYEPFPEEKLRQQGEIAFRSPLLVRQAGKLPDWDRIRLRDVFSALASYISGGRDARGT